MNISPQSKIKCIDFFCGAGGASYGLELSGLVDIAAAVNHDNTALRTHSTNHPFVTHYNADVYEVDEHHLYKNHPDTKMFWWSAECTFQSLAKGGDPREAKSRMLSFQLMKFMDAFKNLEIIGIENVPEFQNWGPLMQKKAKNKSEAARIVGRGYFVDPNMMCWKNKGMTDPYMVADPSEKGTMHREWISMIEARGFKYEYKILNCADYGDRTSRPRYYGIASKGREIKWPEQTHSKGGKDGFLPWLPVKPVLNLGKKGNSIFNRKIPLSEKTIMRIRDGLNRYFPPENGVPYILQYAGSSDVSNIPKGEVIDDCNNADFFIKYYGTAKSKPTTLPIDTITTKDRFGLVQATIDQARFILPYNYGNHPKPITDPLGTIMAKRDKYIVSCDIVSKGYPYVDARLIGDMIVDNRILNANLRMLEVPELLLAQGFPSDYNMPKSSTRAKKFIGNSVPPKMIKKITKSILRE